MHTPDLCEQGDVSSNLVCAQSEKERNNFEVQIFTEWLLL